MDGGKSCTAECAQDIVVTINVGIWGGARHHVDFAFACCSEASVT